MAGVNWLLKIVDGATGPLKNIAAAALKTAAAMRALNAVGGLDKAVKEVEKLAKGEEKVNSALKKQVELRKKLESPASSPGGAVVGGKSKGFQMRGEGMTGILGGLLNVESSVITTLLSPIKAVLGAELEVAKAIGETAFKLSVEGSQLAIEATTARNMSVASLAALMHSQAAGQSLYDQALKLSELIGESPDQVLGKMKKLLSAGIEPGALAPAITTIENATEGISKKAGVAVERAITTAVSKGFMDNRALTTLARAGINVNKVYEALSARMGKSVKDVEMMVRKGKVSSADAIAAIEEVVNKQSGGLAEKRGASVGGRLMAIATEFKNLFSKVDLTPVEGALGNVVKAISGPAGKELQGSVSKFFGTLFHTVFDPFTGAEGQKRLERLLHDVSQALGNATSFIKAAKPYVDWLVKTLLSESSGGGGSKLVETLHSIGVGILDVIGAATGLGPLGDLLDMLEGFEIDDSVFTNATTAARSFITEFKQVGSDLMQGLADGIQDAAASVQDAVMSAVQGAVDAAKSALGIHSPSTVFAQIGDFTAQGFAQGVAANDAPSRAVVGMVSPPTPLAGAAGSAGGGGSHSFNFDVSGMKIDAPGADAKEVAQNIGRELRAEFEAIALELGAA